MKGLDVSTRRQFHHQSNPLKLILAEGNGGVGLLMMQMLVMVLVLVLGTKICGGDGICVHILDIS